ncbi:membrane protein [Spirosoma harenae]
MVLAQGLGNSPYSAIGIGEQYSPAHVANMGMGDVGVSNASVFYMNLQNPALLARRNRFTVFEVGLIGETKGLSQNISNVVHNQNNTAVNLGYLALAFPASSRWNMAISLKPYTYVNYNIRQQTTVPGTVYPAEYNYTGKGGLNKATFSNGYRLGKNIYAGVEGSFLFGNITYSSDSRAYTGSTQDVLVNRLNRVTYSDVVFKLGAAWRPKLSDKWTMNLGATYEPQTGVKAQQTDIYQQTTADKQAIAAPDTLRLNSTSKAILPNQMRFGITLEKSNSLLFGVDVGYQQWSQFRTADNTSGNLSNTMNVAAGIEYTPNPASSRYRDLMTFRAGFQYNQMPYQIGNSKINDINGSLGLSLPIGAYRVNQVTIALVAGQRGVLSATQIRERYVRIALGFSLNDLWFRKPVID